MNERRAQTSSLEMITMEMLLACVLLLLFFYFNSLSLYLEFSGSQSDRLLLLLLVGAHLFFEMKTEHPRSRFKEVRAGHLKRANPDSPSSPEANSKP